MDRHHLGYVIANWWAPIAFGAFALCVAWLYFHVPDVHYRSSDANWADYEINFRERSFERVVYNFEAYKIICKAPDAILYRTTEKNWFNLFAWGNYFHDRKWHVPYAPPDRKIGDYWPHDDQLKHCYNGKWKLTMMEDAQVAMHRYLDALDKRIAAEKR